MQTSIEWFIEHLLGNGLLRLTKEDHSLYSELRDKAKQMHKKELVRNANQLKISNKEIESAFDEGQEYEYQYHINNAPKFDSETYYQETFKKKIT